MDVVFIKIDIVRWGKLTGFLPSCRLFAQQIDVAIKILVSKEAVPELVEQSIGFVFVAMRHKRDGLRRSRPAGAVALNKRYIWIVDAELAS